MQKLNRNVQIYKNTCGNNFKGFTPDKVAWKMNFFSEFFCLEFKDENDIPVLNRNIKSKTFLFTFLNIPWNNADNPNHFPIGVYICQNRMYNMGKQC